MAKIFEGIDEQLGGFLADQPVFFVATRPEPAGRATSTSPPRAWPAPSPSSTRDTVAYLDITGSGIETVAHLRDNGRIVLMFCAFAGPPRIVRLHGRGTVVLPGDGEWEELAARFPPQPGTRSVIKVSVERVSDSCGFGVPLMSYEAERGQLADWAGRKTEEELAEYRRRRTPRASTVCPGLSGIGLFVPAVLPRCQ